MHGGFCVPDHLFTIWPIRQKIIVQHSLLCVISWNVPIYEYFIIQYDGQLCWGSFLIHIKMKKQTPQKGQIEKKKHSIGSDGHQGLGHCKTMQEGHCDVFRSVLWHLYIKIIQGRGAFAPRGRFALLSPTSKLSYMDTKRVTHIKLTYLLCLWEHQWVWMATYSTTE